MKISIKQKEVIKLMLLGWNLAYNNDLQNLNERCWITKDRIGFGGETINVNLNTFNSLIKRGLIIEKYRFPVSEFVVAESVKTLI